MSSVHRLFHFSLVGELDIPIVFLVDSHVQLMGRFVAIFSQGTPMESFALIRHDTLSRWTTRDGRESGDFRLFGPGGGARQEAIHNHLLLGCQIVTLTWTVVKSPP